MSEAADAARRMDMRQLDTCFDRFDGSPAASPTLRPSIVVPVGFLFDVLWSVLAPELRLDVVSASPEVECAFETRTAPDRDPLRIEIVRANTVGRPCGDAHGSVVCVQLNALLATPAACVERTVEDVRAALSARRSPDAVLRPCRSTHRPPRRTPVLSLLSQVVIASAHGVAVPAFAPGADGARAVDLIAA